MQNLNPRPPRGKTLEERCQPTAVGAIKVILFNCSVQHTIVSIILSLFPEQKLELKDETNLHTSQKITGR